MGWIRVVRGTVWCPICPSRTIWGKWLFYAQFVGGAWLRDGRARGRWGPRTSSKVFPIIRGTCGAQSSNLILQKNLPWTPPLTKTGPTNQRFDVGNVGGHARAYSNCARSAHWQTRCHFETSLSRIWRKGTVKCLRAEFNSCDVLEHFYSVLISPVRVRYVSSVWRLKKGGAFELTIVK